MKRQSRKVLLFGIVFVLIAGACAAPVPPTPTPMPTVPAPTATVPPPTATVPPPTATVPPTPRPPTAVPTMVPEITPPAVMPPYAVHGPYAVGARNFSVEDGDHVITLTAWYPALNPDNAREAITYHVADELSEFRGMTVGGRAIQDAAPDIAHGPYPLVIFSAGFTDFRQVSAYLLEHLASYGLVVLASDPRDRPYWAPAATRPIDTKLLISFADKATAPGGALDGLLDMEHIVAVGYGWNVLIAGGGQFSLGWCTAHPNFKLLYADSNCGEFLPHAQEIAAQLGLQAVPSGLWPPMNDPRVKAVIAFAPDGDVWGAEFEGVAIVKVPTLVMAGTWASSNQFGAYPVYEHLGSAQKGLIKLQEATNFIFSTSCRYAPWYTVACSEPSWDIDQAHAFINHFVTAFLLTELKGDKEAAKALAPENVSFTGIEYETTGFEAAK